MIAHDEVRANVHEALEIYIETFRESGQEVPPPRDVQVQTFDIAVTRASAPRST